MTDLKLVLAGTEADAAAAALANVLTEGETATVERQAPEALPEVERKAVDPISLAALILSVPGAVLAVMDIVDRVRKRKKAQALIETAQRLRVEKRVETYVLTVEGVPRSLDGLGPDELLTIAARLGEAG